MELQIYNNEEFGSVRTALLNGTPFFVGKDVADILGYSNPQRALRDHVDEEDTTLNDSFTVNGTKGILINEYGLYSLIFRSQMPKARQFKRWVTSEILPAIRKHGIYAEDEWIPNPDLAIAVFTTLKEEREKRLLLENAVAVQKQQIAEMQPKAAYYDVVLKCKDAVNISVIAKDYSWSARRMNEYLHRKGVQFKQGDIWLLYQKYAGCGYTKTNTHVYEDGCGNKHTKVHTKWTQKGRLFIYSLLKADGIYPQIEMEV